MKDSNKKNILIFQEKSMEKLYEVLKSWQEINEKRFLSLNIIRENEEFCCIALTNPTEVIICDGGGGSQAYVRGGFLGSRETL